jgi:hypothetical protein
MAAKTARVGSGRLKMKNATGVSSINGLCLKRGAGKRAGELKLFLNVTVN